MDAWSDQMRKQINDFGRLLIGFRESLADARPHHAPVGDISISQIDHLLADFERGLRGLEEVERQYQAREPELAALQVQCDRLLRESQTLTVDSQAEYEHCQKVLDEIQRHKELVGAVLDPLIVASEQHCKLLASLQSQLANTLTLAAGGA